MSKRIIMAIIGVCLCGVTVGCFRITELGADPFTVSTLGWAELFNVSYGTIYPFWTGALLLLSLIFDRSRLGIATVINLVLTGVIGDFTYDMLNGFSILHTLPGRIILMIFTLLLLCISSAFYFTADLGVSGYDAVSQIISKRTKWSFRLCRIGTDVACVAFGFICGVRSNIGFGTILTALCMGPIIQFFIDHLAKPLLYGRNKKLTKVEQA